MFSEETIKLLFYPLLIALIMALIGGIGYLIKWLLTKPQTESTLKKTDGETASITATAKKTTLETKMLELDIQKLLTSGDVESVNNFTDNIQELLVFAKNQSLENIRQQNEHQLVVNGLHDQLQEARRTVIEQDETLKKQSTIIDYQREQYEKLSNDWVLTIHELNELKDKHTKVLKEKADAIIERDEARRDSQQTKEKQKGLEKQVQTLIDTMNEHGIHASNG